MQYHEVERYTGPRYTGGYKCVIPDELVRWQMRSRLHKQLLKKQLALKLLREQLLLAVALEEAHIELLNALILEDTHSMLHCATQVVSLLQVVPRNTLTFCGRLYRASCSGPDRSYHASFRGPGRA